MRSLECEMLCREQRTALTTARDLTEASRDLELVVLRLWPPFGAPSPRCCEPCDSERVVDSSSVNRTPASSTSDNSDNSPTRHNRRHIRNYYPRFCEVLVWICLLELMHSSCAAPHRLTSSIRKMETEPLWVNPCGGGTIEETPDDTPVSNKDLFEPVELQANTALSDAEQFKRDYVNLTFKVDFEKHHDTWKHLNYNWLPSLSSIPKALGGNVSTDHLKNIEKEMGSTFAQIYEDLQKIAVGLEQIDHDSDGKTIIFNKAKYFLKEVLCEIHVMMNYRGYERKPDVTRDVMGDEYRIVSSVSDRNLRDWIIFRDYMNAMEYVAQVFKFLKLMPQ